MFFHKIDSSLYVYWNASILMRRWTTRLIRFPVPEQFFFNSEIFNNFQQKIIFRFLNEIFGFYFPKFYPEGIELWYRSKYCSARKNRKFIFGIWNFRNWRYDGYDDAASIGGNENDKKVCFIEAWNPVSRGWRRFYIMSILDDVLEDRPLSFQMIVQF